MNFRKNKHIVWLEAFINNYSRTSTYLSEDIDRQSKP